MSGGGIKNTKNEKAPSGAFFVPNGLCLSERRYNVQQYSISNVQFGLFSLLEWIPTSILEIYLIDMVVFFVVLTYALLAVIGIPIIRKRTANINPYQRITLLSFIYALFFGIGVIAAGNADPGAAMPCPIGLGIIHDISSGWFPFFNLCLLGFWWIVIGVTLLTGKLIKDYRNSRRPHQ